MLRVLQEQRFERVGGNETVQTQVRVLAATNQDLEKLVREGRFRADLYYRLKVVTIQLPPLRERPGDVAELAHYFLFRYDRELGLDLRGFAPEALRLLEAYRWPGNVRELQSAIKQAMLNASGHLILPEFLPEDIRRGAGEASTAPAEPAAGPRDGLDLAGLVESLLRSGEKGVYDRIIAEVDRLVLARVLRHTHGHQSQASDLLGLNRGTLRLKLRSLGMAVDKVPVEEPRREAGANENRPG
jgi:two-component system nitrogen regulation response regulator GlnG